jgi:predicted nucleic acid-binding protein
MKVFLDTNVWLSATVFAGLCEDIVVQCADRGWLVSSHLVRVEAHEVIGRKFPYQTEAVKLFDAVWQSAILNDERLIRSVLRAKTDYFVTGDKRVLSWMQKPPKRLALEQLRIVSPRDAWGELFGAKPDLR